MRRKIYKWHRTLSVIIAVPVALWAISGFMHPVMTNIRPKIATQFYPSPGIDTGQVKISLQQCLLRNKIDSFSNVHIVQMGGQQFYQVIMDGSYLDIRYFSTKTGNLLRNGDELYARFLAKYFLEGSGKKSEPENSGFHHEPVAMSDHDCCMMATMSIMSSRGAAITAIKRVTRFDDEYKYINRLLPVYKVSFGREDGIRIYVETASGRFGFAVDNQRAAFDKFFGLFHTWEWMNALGNTKYFIMTGLTLAAFITTLLGLYIFFTTKTKKAANQLVKARRNHRYTALAASLFTLLFTFSGGYHALDKLLPKELLPDPLPQRFASMDMNADFRKLDSVAAYRTIQNLSFCCMHNKLYCRLYLKKDNAQPDGRLDLMKNLSAEQPDVIYTAMNNYECLQNGDEQYARYLAAAFSNNSNIRSLVPVTKFTDEYGFVNKRLPVWKVNCGINGNERYYIETSTGLLATRVQDKDLAEGYSFAFFHKHHFMDWGGKTLRDISTMFWAAMQVAMVIIGFILYFRSVRRRSSAG